MAWWICDDGKFDQFDVSSVDTVCQAMGEEKLPPESQTGEATNIVIPDLQVKVDQYHPGQFDQAYQFDQSNQIGSSVTLTNLINLTRGSIRIFWLKYNLIKVLSIFQPFPPGMSANPKLSLIPARKNYKTGLNSKTLLNRRGWIEETAEHAQLSYLTIVRLEYLPGQSILCGLSRIQYPPRKRLNISDRCYRYRFNL